MVTSKFGKVLIAVRDQESRARFIGYRVENYKLVAFVASACLAGVAGALYVPQVGIINPSEFSPANSIEIIIWVAVGGRGTLVGAALGAFIVNYAKTLFTGGLVAPFWLFGAALALLAAYLVWKYRLLAAAGLVAGALAAFAGFYLAGTYGVYAPLTVAAIAVSIWILTTHPAAAGATLGALLFIFSRTPFVGVSLAEYWLFALGALFVFVTLLMPKGVIGTFADLRERLNEKRAQHKRKPMPDAAVQPSAAE
jgi:ABC-type branched-subunit amino acid transport system permease subunit